MIYLMYFLSICSRLTYILEERGGPDGQMNNAGNMAHESLFQKILGSNGLAAGAENGVEGLKRRAGTRSG